MRGDRIAYFCLFFVVVGAIALPFPYSIMPNIGKWIVDKIPLANPEIHFSSDSAELFGLFLCIALLGLFFSVFAKRSWLSSTMAFSIAYRFAAFFLSLHLLKYGFDKVFKHQFYHPEPNTLHTPLGMLDKDILYWSAIGSSYGYNVFMGALEVIMALLLLIPKTRRLAGLVSIMIMANILAVNINFDIDVKLLSSFLLFCGCLVGTPALASLLAPKSLLVKWMDTSNIGFRLLQFSGNKLIFLKTFVVFAIILEGTWFFLLNWNFNDDAAPRPPYHGSYQVLHLLENEHEVSLELNNPKAIKRFFIHRKGYLIFQFSDDKMKDYKFLYTDKNGFLKIQPNGWANILGKNDNVKLWVNLPSTQLEITAKKLDW